MKCNIGLFASRDLRLHRDKIQLIDRLSLLLVAIHLIRSRDVCVTFEVTRVRCSLVLSLSLSFSLFPPSFPTHLRSIAVSDARKKDVFKPVRLLPRFFSRLSIYPISSYSTRPTSLTIVARKDRERALLH